MLTSLGLSVLIRAMKMYRPPVSSKRLLLDSEGVTMAVTECCPL